MADQLLFRRQVRLVIDTLEITGLDVTFLIKKSLKPEPNTAEIQVLNLNEDHRAELEQKPSATVQLDVGYESGMSTLFLGDLRTGVSVPDGTEYVTRLSSGDGEAAIKSARVNVCFQQGLANPAMVLETVARSLGVGEGNLPQAVSRIRAAGLTNHFSEGTVLYGSAFREMNAICNSLGLSWSIQDGKLQILPLGQALAGQAILVSRQTGMVGSPTVDNDGVLTVQTLLIPDVFPGRLMVLDADRLKGQYRIESCQYAGDTASTTWYITIEAKRY